MNKVDWVFYLSLIGAAWQTVNIQIKSLVSGNVYAWLNIVLMIVAVFAYALYERINGTTPPPTQP